MLEQSSTFATLDRLMFMSQKDDFTAVSSALRRYLPERDTPYILDVDLDFFSTRNPFKQLHERVDLYDKLAPLFTYRRAESDEPEVSAWSFPALNRVTILFPLSQKERRENHGSFHATRRAKKSLLVRICNFNVREIAVFQRNRIDPRSFVISERK